MVHFDAFADIKRNRTESDQKAWIELISEISTIPTPNPSLHKMAEDFNDLDDNGRGEIVAHRFKYFLRKKHNIILSNKAFKTIVSEVDEDGSQLISFPEFVEVVDSIFLWESSVTLFEFISKVLTNQLFISFLLITLW